MEFKENYYIQECFWLLDSSFMDFFYPIIAKEIFTLVEGSKILLSATFSL